MRYLCQIPALAAQIGQRRHYRFHPLALRSAQSRPLFHPLHDLLLLPSGTSLSV
jgi:hypothetical protein